MRRDVICTCSGTAAGNLPLSTISCDLCPRHFAFAWTLETQ
jgi:hypothetical protein